MKVNKLQEIVMVMIFIFGIGCEVEVDGPPDTTPNWDTDGDGISNAVETNPANSHHGFDTTVVDANPSIAHGSPINGWLEGGINLTDAGRGYYHYYGSDPVDTDDWGTLALINMVEGGGRDWRERYPTPRSGIGDMSLQNGGIWLPHSSHQNGLDVDIRYVRNDGQELPLNITDHPEDYDTLATVDLMNSLFQNGDCVLIVVSEVCGIIFEDIEVRYDTTNVHDNHFHLRIEDPDGTGN